MLPLTLFNDRSESALGIFQQQGSLTPAVSDWQTLSSIEEAFRLRKSSENFQFTLLDSF